jgi:hypothetical protein
MIMRTTSVATKSSWIQFGVVKKLSAKFTITLWEIQGTCTYTSILETSDFHFTYLIFNLHSSTLYAL